MVLHTLIKATEKDIEDICAIEFELFPENNFGEATVRNQLTKGSCWLLRVDGEVAGYMLTTDGDKVVDVIRLGVREQYRQHGIATALLRQVAWGQVDVMLTVRKDNKPAIRLYRKHWFEISGELNHGSACWVMYLKRTSS